MGFGHPTALNWCRLSDHRRHADTQWRVSWAQLRIGLLRTQPLPAAPQNCCSYRSPIDALINIKVRCQLRRQIPFRIDRNTLTGMRIAFVPQRWRARRGNVRRFRVGSDVIEDLSNLRTSVMNAIRRICPPQIGHSSGNTS